MMYLLKLLNIEIRKVLFEGKSSETFDALKNEFIDKTSSYDKIDVLKKDLSDELQSVDSENGKLFIELSDLFIQRKSLFDKIEEREYFLNKVCNDEWNIQQDAGRTIKEAESVLIPKFPDWSKIIPCVSS